MPSCTRSIFHMKPRHVGNIFVFQQVRILTCNIYFYPVLVFISSFIWTSFTYDLYTYIYIYIYMYVYIYMCVCMYVCVCVLFL